MNIQETVKKSLGSDLLSDCTETDYGWVSMRNDDFSLGPRYLISFNYPTKIDEIGYISQFSGEACKRLLGAFYRSTNGMRLFSDHFVVPGVHFRTAEEQGLDFFNIPIDVGLMSGKEYPGHAPVSGAVLGSSFRDMRGETHHLLDILDNEGNIVSGYFKDNPVVTERFSSFQDWISKRIPEARHEFFARHRTGSSS